MFIRMYDLRCVSGVLSIRKNRGFSTNSNFLILAYLQADGVNLCYFKFRLFDLTIQSLKYQRSTTHFDFKVSRSNAKIDDNFS